MLFFYRWEQYRYIAYCIIGKGVTLTTARSIVFKILLNVASVHEGIQIFPVNDSRVRSNQGTMITKNDILEVVSDISGNTYIVPCFTILCDGYHTFAY